LEKIVWLDYSDGKPGKGQKHRKFSLLSGYRQQQMSEPNVHTNISFPFLKLQQVKIITELIISNKAFPSN
jgi:hypothetical protein